MKRRVNTAVFGVPLSVDVSEEASEIAASCTSHSTAVSSAEASAAAASAVLSSTLGMEPHPATLKARSSSHTPKPAGALIVPAPVVDALIVCLPCKHEARHVPRCATGDFR